MTHRIKPGIILLCLLTLLFSGCAREDDRIPIGSNVWEAPPLTYGVWESEKLEVLPWNAGRCEATAFDTMAETPLGYYMSCGSTLLFYADKTTLDNWVPVCNKPNCEHSVNWSAVHGCCNAHMAFSNFVIQNNRIYYPVFSSDYPELYHGNASFVLLSMDPDGTNKQVVYALENGSVTQSVSSVCMLTSKYLLHSDATLDQQGNLIANTYLISGSGVEKLASRTCSEGEFFSGAALSSGRYTPLYGDSVFSDKVLNETGTSFFRYNDGVLESIDTAELPVKFSYLSGDTLRFFRKNDGYYDRNIKTGEEFRLADARLKNSRASIVLPNCIVESTLIAWDSRTEGQLHQMELFDGEAWRSVKLPEELLHASGQQFARVKAVTSDSILFYSRDMATYFNTTEYYRIDLTKEDLELAHCSTVVEPME